MKRAVRIGAQIGHTAGKRTTSWKGGRNPKNSSIGEANDRMDAGSRVSSDIGIYPIWRIPNSEINKRIPKGQTDALFLAPSLSKKQYENKKAMYQRVGQMNFNAMERINGQSEISEWKKETERLSQLNPEERIQHWGIVAKELNGHRFARSAATEATVSSVPIERYSMAKRALCAERMSNVVVTSWLV